MLYQKSVHEAEQELKTSIAQGLTAQEASGAERTQRAEREKRKNQTPDFPVSAQ